MSHSLKVDFECSILWQNIPFTRRRVSDMFDCILSDWKNMRNLCVVMVFEAIDMARISVLYLDLTSAKCSPILKKIRLNLTLTRRSFGLLVTWWRRRNNVTWKGQKKYKNIGYYKYKNKIIISLWGRFRHSTILFLFRWNECFKFGRRNLWRGAF